MNTIDSTITSGKPEEPERQCGYKSDAPDALRCTRKAEIRVTSDHGATMYLCDYHAGVFGAVFAKYFSA